MKYIKTLLSLVLVCFSLLVSAQCTDPNACNFNETTVNDVCLSLETVQVHADGALAGQTTYRLYVNFPADDTYYIGSISGDGDTASNIQSLNISTTTNFYQDPVGSLTANGINPSAFSSFPTLEYDSWITVIGEDNTFATQVSTAGEGWITNFEAGGDIVINSQEGGAWYILNNVDNGQSVNKALIAQLTTDGDISGQVTVNYFAPELGYALRSTLSLDNACEYGQCVYPEAYLTCDGDCATDTDSDGICDEFEVVGCTDITACNYNATATDSDQSLCDFSCVSAIVVSEACDNETTINYNGQDYDLVEIDGRCWFAEDLRTTRDRNGIDVPEITDETTWAALGANDGARTTYFANSGNSFSELYRSYNWYAVETGLLCPTGWHVANNKDWNSLEKTAFGARGQNISSANQLVVGNTQELYDLGWFAEFTDGDVFNAVQFSGGLRTNVDGKWKDDEGSMYWWTAEDYNGRGSNGNRKNSAWARGVKKDASWGRFKDLWSTSGSKSNALRVRCVKGDNTPENIVLSEEPIFFFASGPITNSTTDPDAEVNLQDTVYVDENRTPAPAGYFFANGKGETFVTDTRGILISATGYKLRRDQKIMTIGDSDILDSAFGDGRPMVTCACCCYSGQNSYIQDFTIRSPRGGCAAFCNNQPNCEALTQSFDGGSQDLCWDDMAGSIADTYLDGYVNGGWNPKEYRRFEQILDLVGFEIIDSDLNDPNPYLELRAGAVIQPVLKEENTYTNQQLKDGLSFTKGFIFTFEDKWYKVNDSWTLEGGGDDPLPEWGGAGPQDLHVCACWSEAPECYKQYVWGTGRRGKNCAKLCGSSSTVYPGSPPCEIGETSIYIVPGDTTWYYNEVGVNLNIYDTVYVDENMTTFAKFGRFFTNDEGDSLYVDYDGVLKGPDMIDYLDRDFYSGPEGTVTCMCCQCVPSSGECYQVSVTSTHRRRPCATICEQNGYSSSFNENGSGSDWCSNYEMPPNPINDNIFDRSVRNEFVFNHEGFTVNNFTGDVNSLNGLTISSSSENLSFIKGIYFEYEGREFLVGQDYTIIDVTPTIDAEIGGWPPRKFRASACFCWSDAPECAAMVRFGSVRRSCITICAPLNTYNPCNN